VSEVRVFVNGVGIDIGRESTALDALAKADRAEAEEVRAGGRMITDSRGLSVPPRSAVFAGAIFRTVRAKPSTEEVE
jgi:hypothetical protein